MAGLAGALFPLWAAVAALPHAHAIRDSSDAYASLELSLDEADTSMANEKCCCELGATRDSQCFAVRIKDQQYFLKEGPRGENGGWECPSGYTAHSRGAFPEIPQPTNCMGGPKKKSKRQYWNPDMVPWYEHSPGALRVDSRVVAHKSFVGSNTNSEPYTVDPGLAGTVRSVNEDGTIRVDFGGAVGQADLDENKLSSLCWRLPLAPQRARPDGPSVGATPITQDSAPLDASQNAAKLRLQTIMGARDTAKLRADAYLLETLPGAIQACRSAGLDDGDRDVSEAQRKLRELRSNVGAAMQKLASIQSTSVETDGPGSGGPTASARGSGQEGAGRGEQEAALEALKSILDLEGSDQDVTGSGLSGFLLAQLPGAIARCWEAGLDQTNSRDVQSAIRRLNKVPGGSAKLVRMMEKKKKAKK